MTSAPLSISSERERAVDFSYPFYYEYTSAMTRKPDPNLRKWRTLIDPFKWEVLLCIGMALPIVTTVVFLLEKYNGFYQMPKHAAHRKRQGGLHTWTNSFWYIYGALLCQGGVHLPDSNTGRTFISFWWIFCIVVVGTYSGNLIAFLTVTKERLPFTSLMELSEMSDTYKWGTMRSTLWELWLLTSETKSFRAIGDAMIEFNKTDPDVISISADVHLQKVLDGGYVYITDETFIETSQTIHCNLVKLPENFMPMRYAFGFPNNSPHTKTFTEQVMKISEGGLIDIMKKKWWPKANFCQTYGQAEAKAISLVDVQSAFYVCIVGIFFGFLSFFIELVVYKYRQYKGKRMKTIESSEDLEYHGVR